MTLAVTLAQMFITHKIKNRQISQQKQQIATAENN
jgi:hypothetical protein